MDIRASLGTAHHRSRAPLPQRAVTGGPHALPQPPGFRMTLPPRMSAVRSTSQPVNFVDLTDSSAEDRKRNLLPFLQNGDIVTSPDDVNGVGDSLEPPPKRVKREGAEFTPVKAEEKDKKSELDTQDKVHRKYPGSPLPAPPSFPPISARLGTHRRHRMGVEPSARKAHGIEPPAAAVRLPLPKKAADFSPWTNSHPEDILNENVVKSGYFDKTQGTNQAECNSAKPTIAASLSQKGNPGLQILGLLFSTVLEKRQIGGRCTAPSTFKPPPRVTVTDTKREVWLRDLANPEIPLRKQSRTIPHGIRGKLLMEQCLAKSMPLQRAVWLAKCVGANELRAFRRKGVSGSIAASGEAKWVREWTTHVQQFVEDIVAACGKDEWQRKMNYAVKLSHAFYSEKLLDQDHFLDWIVASFSATDHASLPIGLVLVQLYWKDLTLYVRRGRKLAEGILRHLDTITKGGKAADAPLRTRLHQLVFALGMTNRACLIIPQRWEEFKHFLVFGAADPTRSAVFGSLVRRNESLNQPIHNVRNSRSQILQLCSRVDSVSLDFDIDGLANNCLALVPDTVQLVRVLFDWASTQYRTGISRVYLTARIIAHIRASSTDTDSAIVQYLGTTPDLSPTSVDYIHRVVVELVHLKAFSIGKYLLWLITGGMITGGSACATGLVAALPTTDLPLHVINTRKTILKRIGEPVDETEAVQKMMLEIDAANISATDDEAMHILLSPDLSVSTKFDTCRQICNWISVKAEEDSLTLGAVCMARSIIEQMQDVHSLVSLVQSTMASDNSSILATLCDTINLHAESFAASGELKVLTDDMADRYIALRSLQPLERALILALLCLAERVADKAALVKLLKDDLAISNQQSSAVVCSPASDSLIGMHASTLDSDEDLDAVFASGNTMDEQLMQRVFIRVLQRMPMQKASRLGSTSRVCGWLNQLRSVGGAGMFEDLMQSHISSVLTSDVDYNFWTNGVVHLVASGCLSLCDVVDRVAAKIQCPDTAVRMLSLFLSEDVTAAVELHDVEIYRFRLQQDRCRDMKDEQLLRLLKIACRSSLFREDNVGMRSFLVRAMSRHFNTPIMADADEQSWESMGRLFGAILADTSGSRSETMRTRDIVNLATPLSIAFCIALLECTKELTSLDDGVMGDALLEAYNNNSEVWPQLLECAGETVNAKVRDWAKDQALLLTAGTDSGTTTIPDPQRLLNLLAVSSSLAPEADDTSAVLTLTERLKELEGKLNELGPFNLELQGQATDLLTQLHILLQLVKFHIHPPAIDHQPSQESRVPLLAVICTLITVPYLQLQGPLQEELSDLASVFASSLPDAAIAATKQLCPPAILSDPRIKLLLGSISDPTTNENGLMLASHTHPGGSQQQRLLKTAAAAAQQHSPGGSRMPLPQSQHQRVLSLGGSPGLMRGPTGGVGAGEVKMTPFVVRQWEMIPDSAPILGENDTSLSLRLFGARKVG